MVSDKQKRAITALLDGDDKQDAATAAGVNPQTISRWLQDDEFRSELTAGSDKAFQNAAARLTGAMDGAISTLVTVSATGGKGTAVKVRAASLILSHAEKIKEIADLSERIQALEELIHEQSKRP